MHSRNKKDVTPCKKKVYKKFNPNIVALLRLLSHRYAIATPFLQKSSDTESESADGTDSVLGSRALRSGGKVRGTNGGLRYELAWLGRQDT
jgi:hypothetical protein